MQIQTQTFTNILYHLDSNCLYGYPEQLGHLLLGFFGFFLKNETSLLSTATPQF